MENKDLDSFVDSLIEDKDIPGLTPEVREQVAEEIKGSIIEQINKAVLMELSDEQLDELNALMDKEGFTEQDMQNFIANSGVDLDRITAETLLYYRSFYLGNNQ